jgi:P27 family predicted phage terminase small subunit
MGARGAKPLPTKILQLRHSKDATYRKREPMPAPGVPDFPAWLDAEVRPVWDFLCTELAAIGILAKLDGLALGRYVRLHQRWVKAESFIKQYGETYPLKNKEGDVYGFQAFPQTYIASNLAAQLHRLEHSFGLSPSARAGIGLLNAAAGKIYADTDPTAKKSKQRFFRDSA